MLTVSTDRLFRSQPFARTVVAHLYLGRAVNALVVFAATILGAILAGVSAPLGVPVLAVATSNGLLAAASTAFNDWRDAATDMINRPMRPIPSGQLDSAHAARLALVWFAAAIGIATLAGTVLTIQAAAVGAGSVAYTLALKRVPLLGNSLAALLWAYPLWCWISLMDPVRRPASLSIALAFVTMGIGQELLNTARDAKGDQATGVTTAATRWGPATATRLGVVLMLAAVAIAWIPVALVANLPTYRSTLLIATVACAVLVPRLAHDATAAASHRLVLLGRVIVVSSGLALLRDLFVG